MKDLISVEKQLIQAIPNLLRYGEIISGNLHDAEDITQEVVFRALQKLDEYDPQKGSISTWLQGFMVRVLEEYKRKRRKIICDNEMIKLIMNHWQEQEMEPSEPLEALQSCLSSLSGEDRELLCWHYQQGCLLEEISRRLGKTLVSVKVKFHRLRRQLLHCVHRKVKGKDYE